MILPIRVAKLRLAEFRRSGSMQVPMEQHFIDMMVPHHESAVAMAQLARERAEHAELRQLADDVISAQEGEIQQMRAWRQAWFGSAQTPGMAQMPMFPGSMPKDGMSGETMDMTEKINQLRDAERFDLEFIDAMIEHHQVAIEAGKIALNQSTRREIQTLAHEMVAAQTREIEQMSEWRAAWSHP
jgi:uncharacterized protein (DUF305 family)